MIYLDYAATSPVDPRVKAAMLEAFDLAGNPSSLHAAGRAARAAVDRARRSVSSLLGCLPGEIVFTSGATESNALAVEGTIRSAAAGSVPHVLTSPIEHPSVMAVLDRLRERGEARVELLPVDRSGRVSADAVSAAIRPETVLVCVMWVNNVLGSVQPVAEIGAAVAAERGRRGASGVPIAFFCDAVQAARTVDIAPRNAGIDLMSISGHKICGPKGIGALYARRGLRLSPMLVGGEQEAGLRSGTENVAGIIGFGKAVEILRAEREADARRAAALRDMLLCALQTTDHRLQTPPFRLLSPADAAPDILYFRHARHDGETLAMKLDAAGIAVSTGSACASGARKPSVSLAAVHGEQAARHGGVRVSFGRFTTEDDVRSLAEALSRI